MSLPTAIERLNAHLIGFVRAYTFQLARGIQPQLPNGSSDGADAPGHQAALQAARAIVRTARDKLDVRRMLSALENHLAGLGRDPSEPFQRLLAELGDSAEPATRQPAEPAVVAVPAAVEVVEPAAAAAPPAAVVESEPPAAAVVESAPVSAVVVAATVEVVEEAPPAPPSPVEPAVVEAEAAVEAPVAAEAAEAPVAVVPVEDVAVEASPEPSDAQP